MKLTVSLFCTKSIHVYRCFSYWGWSNKDFLLVHDHDARRYAGYWQIDLRVWDIICLSFYLTSSLSVKFTLDADKEAVWHNLTNFSFTELPSFPWINNVCCFLKSRFELLNLFELLPGEDHFPRKPCNLIFHKFLQRIKITTPC